MLNVLCGAKISTTYNDVRIFQFMFQGMTNQAYDTLPKQKGAVKIAQGTIGRHTKFGKESAA